MSHPIALITGGNRSIGLQVAKDLYAKGFSIVLGCRDANKARTAITEISQGPKQADSQKLTFIVLDISDASTIPTAVTEYKAQYDRLDVLVDNAAIATEDRKAVADINFFNTIALTEAFLPLLAASAPKTATKRARVVIVSSRMGCFNVAQATGDALAAITEPTDLNKITAIAKAWAAGDDNTGLSAAIPYATSKALINAYGRILAQRLAKEQTPVDVIITCPGSTKTDMNPNGNKTVVEGADTISWASYDPSVKSGEFYGERAPIPYDYFDMSTLNKKDE